MSRDYFTFKYYAIYSKASSKALLGFRLQKYDFLIYASFLIVTSLFIAL